MSEALRILVTVLAFACIIGFPLAIVHARDNTDRVYLLGTAALIASGGAGSLAHLHDPIRPAVAAALALTLFGQVLLLFGTILSRRRRRAANPPGGRRD